MKRATLTLALCAMLMASAFAQTPKPEPFIPAGPDWTFPAKGQPCDRDAETRLCVYDLGDGFFATPMKISDARIVIVAFRRIPDEIADSAFAVVVASKVFKLPRDLADTILKSKTKHEHLFRTASGKTAGVTIAADRASAVVRLVTIDPEPFDN